MKLLREKLLENLNKYLNDLDDYGTEEEYQNAIDVLDPLKTLSEDSSTNLYEVLKEKANESPSCKRIIIEFITYCRDIQ